VPAGLQDLQGQADLCDSRIVLVSSGGHLAVKNSRERENLEGDPRHLLVDGARIFGLKVGKSGHGQNHVQSISDGSAEHGRLRAGYEDAAGAPGRLCYSLVPDFLEPEIYVLGGAPGSLQERSAHPDDQETDVELLKLFQESALALTEKFAVGVVHG